MGTWINEFEELLEATKSEWSLYSFFAHGWMSQDEENSDYRGSTAWSKGDLRPVRLDELLWGSSSAADPEDLADKPTHGAIMVAVAAEDFVGLMDMGLLHASQAIAFGRTCVDAQHPDEKFADWMYWVNRCACLSSLTSAAERLVQMCVHAGLRMEKAPKSREDTTIDKVLRLTPTSRYQRECLDRCLKCANEAQWAVRQRHEQVHESGSPQGRLERVLLSNNAARMPIFASRASHQHASTRSFDEISNLARGYRAMVEFGNMVFAAVAEAKGLRDRPAE